MTLVQTASFIKFEKEFTFNTQRTMFEASYLAADCDSLVEFESLLKAEEVEYQTVDTKFVEPNDSTSNHQMSLL